MQKQKLPLAALALLLLCAACKKDEAEAQLQFQFRFDASQPRLNNLGQPATLPAGHAAQTPDFHKLCVHYIELAPTAFTQLEQGAVVYKAPETNAGGARAIDFDKAVVAGENEIFTKISLKDVPPGTYEWVRASVAYQNYDVAFNIKNIPLIGNLDQQHGTVASFLGFNTYISSITPRTMTQAVNDDRLQGFWVFETALSPPYDAYNQLSFGEAPAGATTVVNPIADTSPIPPGSCIITGRFAQPLVVTGDESEDRTVTLSFSIQQSFEWVDGNGNGQLDIYADQSTQPEQIVDMGLRGLVPSF